MAKLPKSIPIRRESLPARRGPQTFFATSAATTRRRGLEQLGRGLEQFGGALHERGLLEQQRELQAQQERDSIAASSAFGKFSDDMRSSFIDYSSRRGRGAIGVTTDYRQRFDEEINKVSSQLNNSAQEAMFSKLALTLRNSQLNRLQSLEATQHQVAKKNAKDSLFSNISGLIESNLDVNVINSSINSYEEAAKNLYPGQNISHELKEDARNLRQGAIDTAIATNLQHANALNEALKADIGAVQYQKNQKKILAEVNFQKNLAERKKAEASKEREALWYSNLQKADRDNDFRTWQNIIDNAPPRLKRYARNEQKALDRAMSTNVRTQTDPQVFDELYDKALEGQLDPEEAKDKLNVSLSRKDFERVLKINKNSQKDEWKAFNNQLKLTLTATGQVVGGGNALIGFKSPFKAAQAKQAINTVVQDAIDTGKKPEELIPLIDLNNPDSAANKIILEYKPTMQDKLDELTKDIGGESPTPEESKPQQRQPGETIQQYLDRVGG